MYNYIINQLSEIENVDFIYCRTKYNDNMKTIAFDIIVNGDNILSNMEECKKVVAIMEVFKALNTKQNVNIQYDIKSSTFFEILLTSNNKNVKEKYHDINGIIYSKDDYFQSIIESFNTKDSKRSM